MSPALRLQLLGDFRLTWFDAGTETPVTTVASPRLQSLLAYLVLHCQAPQSRQYLAFCFWPDLSEARARSNLRKLFFQLQKALPCPEQFLITTTQTLQWHPGSRYTLDVAEFERLAGSNDPAGWRQAMALFRGDLLPSCYDDWILAERERLQQTLLGVIERLLQSAEQEGDYRHAIILAQRLLNLDPLREDTHRRLIRLHAANEDRPAALRAYHTCASLLYRELGVEPGPATRQVYERLLNVEYAPRALAAAFPLFGRDEAWAQLLSTWRKASSGRPQCVLVSGEAGIGKSRLAEELVAWTGRQGVYGAVTHCYPAESALAYAPLTTWLRARPLPPLEPVWLTEIARLLPESLAQHPDLPAPGPLTEPWQRQRLHEALARALASRAPQLLVIEDLQWGDQETHEWLLNFLRFNPRAPLLVLGTLRKEDLSNIHPASRLAAALRASRQLTEIELQPLDAEASQQLAEAAGRATLTADAAAWLFLETEGNPLFIVETIRTSSLEPGKPRLLMSIQSVLGSRLAQLTPPAGELVGFAAVIGRGFTFEILQQASGVDEPVLVSALDELWHRRIVREISANSYDFTHAKLREVAYAGLSPARRRLLHRKVAEALRNALPGSRDVLSMEIARHYERAGYPDLAVDFFQRAARLARQVYANETALECLNRALALITPEALEQRYELMLAREEVFHIMGQRRPQLQDVTALVSMAATLGDKHKQIASSLRQARYALATSDYEGAAQAARQVIALAVANGDISGQAAGHLQWGRSLW